MNQPPRVDDRSVAARQLFTSSLRRVVVAWLLGLIIVSALAWAYDTSLFRSAWIISVASGVIAVAALWPMSWFSGNAKSDPADGLVAAFMLGIMMRLFGTVALFLLCRYQLGRQPEMIAALVGGWYVWLTSVEVISLTKINAQLHRANVDASADTESSGCVDVVTANSASPARTPLTD